MKPIVLSGGLGLVLVAVVNLIRDTYSHRSQHLASDLLQVQSGKSPAIVLIMQAADCLRDGAVVRRWKHLADSSGVPVRAVLIDRSRLSEEQDSLLSAGGLSMPTSAIRRVDAEALAGRLGYKTTPFAVVVDDRRVLAAFPGRANVTPGMIQQLFASEIESDQQDRVR